MAEMMAKGGFYIAAGALEYWLCDENGMPSLKLRKLKSYEELNTWKRTYG